jgi:hypothetical protein
MKSGYLAEIPVVISSVALAVSIMSMRRQWRTARNANAVAAILKLFEEYRSEELRSARRIIFQMAPFAQGQTPTLRDLPDDVRAAIERVAHFFDHVGLLVGHRLVPAKPMVSFFGFGCVQLWDKVEPYISAERNLRNVSYYLGFFEGLARLSLQATPDELNRDVIARMSTGGFSLD